MFFCIHRGWTRAHYNTSHHQQMGKTHQLYLFKKTGEDPIRGGTLVDKGGNEVYAWSVYDYLCVLFGKKTTTNFGRVMFSRVVKRFGNKVQAKCKAMQLGKGADTPTMEEADLQWLLLAVKHDDLDTAQTVNTTLFNLCNGDADDLIVRAENDE